MRKRVGLILFAVLTLFFTACEKKVEVADGINSENITEYKEKMHYETEKVIKGDLIESKEVDLAALPMVTREVSFEFDVSVKEVHVRLDRMIKKGTLILELDTTDIEREVEVKRFSLQKENHLYEEMIKKEMDSREIEIQRLEVEILKEELNILLSNMEKMKVYALTDCYIKIGNPSKGRKYTAKKPILRLVDSSKCVLRSKGSIDSSQYQNVNIGDMVSVRGLAKQYRARVSFIKTQGNDVKDIYLEYVPEMDIGDKKIESLKLEGKFESLTAGNVLMVSRDAIIETEKTYVEVINSGIRKVRYVEIGVSGKNDLNKGMVQIVDGLKEGDEVVVDKMLIAEKEFWETLKRIRTGKRN